MNPPGLTGLPLELQVGIWILLAIIGSLAGVVVFFVKSFLDDLKLKFAEIFQKFKSQADAIDKVVTQTHEAISSVKAEVRDDLSSFKLESKEIRNIIHDARVDIRGFQKDVQRIETELVQFHKTNEAQQQNISNIAKAINVHQEKIQTIILKLGPNSIMVKNKK